MIGMTYHGEVRRERDTKWRVLCATLFLFMILVAPVSAHINVWQVLVEPDGEIIGNQTRVTVTAFMDIYSEDRVTFSSDNTLRIKTDLEDAVWSPVLLYDGRLTEFPVRQGKSMALSSWDLSYPSGKKEALKVVVKGWAPGVASDQEKTLLWLAEESPHGIVNHTEKKKEVLVLFRPGATREEVPVVPVGSLHITSDPPGAKVQLAGEPRGTTPVTLSQVPAGDQELTLSLPGYHDAVITVSVLARETVEVSSRLIPGTGAATGVLAVESSPPSATVLLNSEKKGITPLTIDTLSPGEYTLRLELEGYAPYKKEVKVTAGGISVQSVALAAHPPSLLKSSESAPPPADERTCNVRITSSPPGADVILDGNFRGLTPITISSLPQGPHTMTLSLPFFAARTEQFTLSPGEEKGMHYTFGFHEFQLPGLDAITGLFSGVKIGLPALPFGGEGQKDPPRSDREKAYEEMMKQIEEGEE